MEKIIVRILKPILRVFYVIRITISVLIAFDKKSEYEYIEILNLKTITKVMGKANKEFDVYWNLYID